MQNIPDEEYDILDTIDNDVEIHISIEGTELLDQTEEDIPVVESGQAEEDIPVVESGQTEEDIPVVESDQADEDIPVVAMEEIEEDIPVDEIDRTIEHENSAKKDLKFLDDMREFIRTGKSTCSNNLLSFLVQVEDLVQRKRTLTVKKI